MESFSNTCFVDERCASCSFYSVWQESETFLLQWHAPNDVLSLSLSPSQHSTFHLIIFFPPIRQLLFIHHPFYILFNFFPFFLFNFLLAEKKRIQRKVKLKHFRKKTKGVKSRKEIKKMELKRVTKEKLWSQKEKI